MRQTQKNWILDFIDFHGSVTPARMGGQIWDSRLWPSQGDKRCREMRAAGILLSERDGKFEKFYRADRILIPNIEVYNEPSRLFALPKIISN